MTTATQPNSLVSRRTIPDYPTDAEFKAHLNGYDSGRNDARRHFHKAVETANLQSKKASFGEAVTNTVIGYGLAIVTQLIVFPLFDIEVNIAENMAIAFIFSAVSIARSYVIRRLFNGR